MRRSLVALNNADLLLCERSLGSVVQIAYRCVIAYWWCFLRKNIRKLFLLFFAIGFFVLYTFYILRGSNSRKFFECI